MDDAATDFEAHRPALLALAYRMLGDFGRAEDIVQDAWLRWQRRNEPIDSPKAYLVKIVVRLCLNELSSARVRLEEHRADRLPEPISLDGAGLHGLEILDHVSMAFLVLLQRLTPAERAALLLHDVFDFDHREIATLLAKTEPACRQILKRAREQVELEKRSFVISRAEHWRLLRAFVAAAGNGDVETIKRLLVEDVVLVADAGAGGGTYGRTRNLPRPLEGREKVAAFVAAVGPQGADGVSLVERVLNGQPAVVVCRDGRPFTVIMLDVVADRIRGIFMQADAARLRHVTTVGTPESDDIGA